MVQKVKKLISIILAVAVIMSGTLILPPQGLAESLSETNGKTISGAISLPSGVSAPSGGFAGTVNIVAAGGHSLYSAQFNVPEGINSTTYTVTVPSDESISEYRVRYDLHDDYLGYVKNGYYSISGTTTNSNSATLIDVNSGDTTGINLTINTGNTISGTISLPLGETAPIDGLEGKVVISTSSYDEHYYTGFYIPAGSSSASYTVTVSGESSITEYRVEYYFPESYAGYVGSGFYSMYGTTDYSSATLVNVSTGNITGINLMIFTGNIISGTIALPSALLAPAGGLEGGIHVDSQNYERGYYSHFEITEGSNSVNYTVTVPEDTSFTEYRVRYLLSNNVSGYSYYGYYSAGGTTTNIDSATLVDVSEGNQTGINLTTLLTGTSIVAGTVSLPSGEIAPLGGIEGEVYFSPEFGGSSYSANFNIPEGSGSGNYTVTVPVEVTNTTYRVSYNLSGDTNGYLSDGYYSTGGTTSNYYSATLVEVSEGNQTGINLTLLTGIMISGTISLPGVETAPSGGIEGELYLSPQGGGYGQYGNFFIPEGARSASYSVTLPENPLIIGYHVSYYIEDNNSRYLNEGYYSTGGTTSNYDSATLVDVSEGNQTGINLTLLTGIMISGTISLPGVETAPSGGIEGEIYLSPQGSGDSQYGNFFIPEGAESASYSIMVPPEDALITEYHVGYYIYDNNTGYLNEGYYSTAGTTPSYDSATLVNLSAGNLTEVDLTLLAATTISGIISLPEGETAPSGGLQGYVSIVPSISEDGEYYENYFSIPAGESSASYTVTVPEEGSATGYRVSYTLYTSLGGYLSDGYYSQEGTTSDYDSATLVNVSSGNLTGVDLTLLTTTVTEDDYGNTLDLATQISIGTNISGQLDPAGDIDVFKFTPSHSGTYSFTTLSDYDTYGILLNTDGSYLTHNDDAGDVSNFLITQDLQADQDYYIEVSMFGSSIGNYQLSVTETDTIPVNTISGTISLPGVEVAPSEGLEGYIYLAPLDDGEILETHFSIVAGARSASYTVNVPVDTSISGYLVNYELNADNATNAGYIIEGYYSTTGTTASNSATIVDVNSGNANNIDLTLLKGNVMPNAISLNKSTATISVDQSELLTATILPDNTTDNSVTWSVYSENGNNIATVSEIGLVTAVNEGTAVIRATSNADSTKYAECTVTVTTSAVVDFSTLTTAISMAQAKYDGATEGTELGQYAVGSKLILETAITAAQTIVDLGTATAEEVAQAVTTLNNAVNTFEEGEVLPVGYSATPVVQIGVNPSAGGIAGMFIGLDSTRTISGYQIEVTFDPNQVSISDVLDETESGELFSKNIEIENGIGKVRVASAPDGSIDNANKLFFIPITLKGSAQDLTSISVKYIDIRDTDLNRIQIPTLGNLTFQRGKVYNGELGEPNIVDAVAGLQYLAKVRNPGFGSKDVNLVNMASIDLNVNSSIAMPNVKDIIALMQYTVRLRDDHFLPLNLTPNELDPGIVTGEFERWKINTTALGASTDYEILLSDNTIYSVTTDDNKSIVFTEVQMEKLASLGAETLEIREPANGSLPASPYVTLLDVTSMGAAPEGMTRAPNNDGYNTGDELLLGGDVLSKHYEIKVGADAWTGDINNQPHVSSSGSGDLTDLTIPSENTALLVRLQGKADKVPSASSVVPSGSSSTPVTSITVNSAGNATSVQEGSTLEMSAVVLPENATDQTVTWSVTTLVGGIATINPETGVLTGSGQGTVTVTATNVASDVTGTKVITVTPDPELIVTSSAFVDGDSIPNVHILSGEENGYTVSGATNRSIPLNWESAAPAGHSFFIIMTDISAGNWNHWVVKNIPNNLTSINAGASSASDQPGTMPSGSKELLTSWGLYDGFAKGYYGPKPPIGSGIHYYEIQVYELDTTTIDTEDEGTGYSYDKLKDKIDSHIVRSGKITGTYTAP